MAKVLGLITARGGSKGIPGKNIKPLLGKPLIAYTIETAKASGIFDRLIISTDDQRIADVAKQYGCEVPFLRPAELAQDATPHLPVLQHAVQWLKDHGAYSPDYVMLLQPTAPALQAFHIKDAVDMILKNGADSVLSVAEVPDHFNHSASMILREDGALRLINGDPIYKRIPRRQDRPKNYWSANLIYLFKTDLLFSANPNFYGEHTAPMIVDSKYAIDIDTPEDWEKAESALRQL